MITDQPGVFWLRLSRWHQDSVPDIPCSQSLWEEIKKEISPQKSGSVVAELLEHQIKHEIDHFSDTTTQWLAIELVRRRNQLVSLGKP